MTYLYSVLAQVGDKKAFTEASQTWVGGHLEKLGVRSYSATEIVMGGEMAGLCVIGFEYDSVDAAMAGQAGFYQDSELVGMMQATQVHVNRRILFRVQSERGERRGQYGTILYMAGRPVDDATMESNMDHNWSHIQNGANGLTWLMSVAAGPAPFNATAVTWTDSLDDLLAASNKMFADPKTMQIMTDSGAQILGRVIGRNML
ncbi:MAG: hypothetical protein EBS76_06735 [Actinobacteria bacterium]|nr:hypothetical protein [Actinomycetota bacterium]